MREYDKISRLIASDRGIYFFRRFGALNAKNLLYYQAEMVNLEMELQDIIDIDKEPGNPEKAHYPYSVYDLKKSLSNQVEQKSAQWLKFLEIRELLEKYNRALLDQREILRLCSPEKNDLGAFREWLNRMDSGEETGVGLFSEMNQWSTDNEKDLLALMGRQEGEDHLTRWMAGKAVSIYHDVWGYKSTKRADVEMGVSRYEAHTIKRFTRFFGIVVSAVLPASAMILLYFVKNTITRLTTIFLYNIIFSFALGLMVKARPIEIFAAATAFAAVQVTMITNAPGGG